MGSQLIALSGPLAGSKFPLPPTVTAIGADPFNHITWPDGQLASYHAQIRWQGDGHVLVDLGSASGTFLNAQRVAAPLPLQPGDRIRIGGSTFLYMLSQPQSVGIPERPQPITPPLTAPREQRSRWIIWFVLLCALALLAAFALWILPRLWGTLMSPAKPGGTVLPVPSPTATRGFTLPAATASPEARPKYYPAPILLGPADGFAGTHIILQWSWQGALDTYEWYEIWAWRQEEEPRGLAWSKVPQYEIGPGPAPGAYRWQVVVVQGVTPNQKQRDLSAPSGIRNFTLIALTATPTLRPTITPTPLPPTATGTFTPLPLARVIVLGTVYNAQRGLGAPIPNAEVRVYLLDHRATVRTDALGRYSAEFRLPGPTAGQRLDLLAFAAGYDPGAAQATLATQDPNAPQYVRVDLGLLPSPTPTPTWIPPTAMPTRAPTATPAYTTTPTHTATVTMTSLVTPSHAPSATASATSMPTTVTPAPRPP